MTKEDILKAYLEDDLFIQKYHLSKEDVENVRFSDASSNKLIEVIKRAIESTLKSEFETTTIARALNIYLNK